jgi:hypothetical protein
MSESIDTPKVTELEQRVQKVEDACVEMRRRCEALTEVIRTIQQKNYVRPDRDQG